jgi:hypothetical protein
MTFRSGAGQTVEEIGRGGAHKLLSPATKAVQDKLAEMHNQDIYIVWEDDFYQGGFVNAWLAYFARHNRVWLYNPILSDADLSKFPQAKQSPENLPDDFFMLTSLSRVFGHSLQLIWSADPYHLWQLSSGEDWLFLRDFINANGLEDWGGELGFWLGQGDTEIDLIASRNGQLEISGYFTPGPSLPDKTTRRILITTDQGYNREVTLDGEGTHELSIPVTMGQNSITLRPLDKPTLDILPNGDTRPLLVGIRGLHIVNFQ